ncbi:MAG: FlgD immunoglobulin-like domain containing protein [Solirubrobacteraceae bacterium]
MSRAPVAAFVALVIATVGAFFVTQHLKVTTPLIQGRPAPFPSTINPVSGGICLRRNGKGVLAPVSFRRMKVSFYLQNRSDQVEVYILDHNKQPVRQIGTDVFMSAHPPKRHEFRWDGRIADGAVAPAGVYYIKVALLHEARSFLISNSTAAERVTVQTARPHVRVTAVSPDSVVSGSATPITIRYTGTDALRPRILIYRVRRGRPPHQVKSYSATSRAGASVWNGTLANGRRAPAGTYVAGVLLTNQSCTTGRSPVTPAAAPQAVITVR